MLRPCIVFCLLALAAAPVTATKHIITAPGFTFSPPTLVITEGDTVVFSISGIHNAQEVSHATWNADGTTPLGGGFTVAFGGGEAIPSGVGTHYYVCQAHVGTNSMKGTITVNAAPEPLSTVHVFSIVDRDGNIGSTSDRVGKNWSLKLYKDSVGSGIVVDSVLSAASLDADSLEAGTYVAVEADSLYWTHISQTVDFVPAGLTSLNYRSIVVGDAETRFVEFLNYAPNVVISSGLVFIPDTISVDSSDTVRFVLDPMHNAREVDSVAWLANDTISNGGFDMPLAGGDVVMSNPGTFYYICVPHRLDAMKGVILVSPTGALSLDVAEGWNLLSMPFLPADSAVTAIYPTASSAAFHYQAGYQSHSSVSPGLGYWLKFAGGQSVDLDGGVVSAETVAVSQGWNILGSLSFPVPVASIQSDPGGMITSPFYSYSAGYSTADTLQPGFGYWVKVGSSGSLILQASPVAAPESRRIRIVPSAEVPGPRPVSGSGSER